MIGLGLPYGSIPNNPLEGEELDHVFGHIIWGMIAGLVALSVRYMIMAGMFGIILDADHLVNFLQIDVVTRMSHSIPFAIISCVIMMMIFGRRDYLLGAVCVAAVFAHMSFDTLHNTGKFPIFAPFIEYSTNFSGTDWIYLEVIAIIIIFSGALFKKNIQYQKIIKLINKFKSA